MNNFSEDDVGDEGEHNDMQSNVVVDVPEKQKNLQQPDQNLAPNDLPPENDDDHTPSRIQVVTEREDSKPNGKEVLKGEGGIEESRQKNESSDKDEQPYKDIDYSKLKSVSYFQLFKYCSFCEKLFVLLGILLSLGQGVTQSMLVVVFSDGISDMGGGTILTEDDVVNNCYEIAIKSFWLGAIMIGISSIASFTWKVIGLLIEHRMKIDFFRAILVQDTAWYDVISPDKISTIYGEDTTNFIKSVGEGNHTLGNITGMMLGGFFLSFYYAAILTLVTLCVAPLSVIGAVFFMWGMTAGEKGSKQSYIAAGSLAEQAICGIRTVKSQNGEAHEIEKYNEKIEAAKNEMLRYLLCMSTAFGLFMASMVFFYGFGFLFGAIFMKNKYTNVNTNEQYTVNEILITFFSVMTGSEALGMLPTPLKAMVKGKQSAATIYQILEQNPHIKQNDQSHKNLTSMTGDIELRNVSFNYPSRPKIMVLKDLNMKIPAGKKVAFVGTTGCGKSTIIQLVERFYDPDMGEILIDGVNLKDMNLTSLRSFMGYVGQEPVQFSMSIKQNLLLAKPDATDAQLEDSLRKANAWVFIEKLHDGIDTFCGDGGLQLSGGQKQRVAIARAILQDPPILLLDESTSALDRKNEREIQETLDKFAKGRTTLTIAHRLTTIKNSDLIYCLEGGKVAEFGPHEELMKIPNGVYSNLVHFQFEGSDELENHDQEGDHDIVPTECQSPVKLKKQKQSSQKKENPTDKKEQTQAEQLIEIQKEKAKKEAEKKVPYGLLWELMDGKKCAFWIGILMNIVAGAGMPLLGLFLGKMIFAFTKYSYGTTAMDDQAWTDSVELVVAFFVLGGASFVSNFQGTYFMNVSGEHLTKNLRSIAYKKFIYNDIGFYDNPENRPGSCCTALGNDAKIMNSLITTAMGSMTQSISTTLTGVIIGFIYSWRMSLITLAVFPLFVIVNAVQMAEFGDIAGGGLSAGTSIVQENVTNIRTVRAMNTMEDTLKRFKTEIQGEKLNYCGAGCKAFFYGISQGLMFYIFGYLFYLGAIFQRDYGVGFNDNLIAQLAIIFSAFGAGMAGGLAGDMGAATQAGHRISDMLYDDSLISKEGNIKKPKNPIIIEAKNKVSHAPEQKPDVKEEEEIDPNCGTGECLGKVEFRNVTFRYPTRKDNVFENINFVVHAGQKVAFAGPSGQGKSTAVGLQLRFYDPQSGIILIDDIDIRKMDVKVLRSKFGLVGQEPYLFNDTIHYNIKYNCYDVSDDDIRQSAIISNAIKFIEQDEKMDQNEDNDKDATGFQRKVGVKGSNLSGGQKQRVAIARAVLRKPAIYLYDEATSALDANSEHIVQEALNKLSEGRTTLTIAHRISTIQDSDLILVINHKRVAEQGTYHELMAKKGLFWYINKDK